MRPVCPSWYIETKPTPLFARFIDGDFGRLLGDHLAKGPIAADLRHGGRLFDDFRLGGRLELAFFDRARVIGRADDTMRVVPGQVGVHQMPRHDVGVVGSRAGGGQDAGDDVGQIVGLNTIGINLSSCALNSLSS